MRVRGWILAFLNCFSAATAQTEGCAFIDQTRGGAEISAFSWHPVDDIAFTLADRYGVRVSVESPRWAYPLDTEHVADADPEFSHSHHNIDYLVMKRHALVIRFPVAGDGSIQDVPQVLEQLVSVANRQLPYVYRLDRIGDEYALIPTKTLNAWGNPEDAQPLLDLPVSLAAGLRPIHEHAQLMADHLTRATGLHVSCCQAMVAGVPWGMAEIEFQADNEPAREVLRKLIRLEDQTNSGSGARHPAYDRWEVNCDGSGAPWCFIEVQRTSAQQCR
jgi:hypothetical protein